MVKNAPPPGTPSLDAGFEQGAPEKRVSVSQQQSTRPTRVSIGAGDAPLQERSERRSNLPPGASARRKSVKKKIDLTTMVMPKSEVELRQEAGMLYVISAARLSDEQLRRAKSKFFEVDRDNSGSIDKEELVAMMHGLGVEPGDDEIERMMEGADTGDKDGKIDLREFLHWYARGAQHQANALQARDLSPGPSGPARDMQPPGAVSCTPTHTPRSKT